MKVKILGTGAYAPDTVVTNADLEKIVETSDQWITKRTGIKRRRKAPEGQTTSDLAAEAGRRALEAAGVRPDEVDSLLVATSTPDRIVPPTAVYVQRKLECWNAGASDLIAACSGFTYALEMAKGLIAGGLSRRCLIIGAEILTRITNYRDRATCVIFGDGAGAALVGPSNGESDILYTRMGCDGRLDELIITWTGTTARPPTAEDLEKGLHLLEMKGREVYKFAVPKFVEIIKEAVRACNLDFSDITHFIPHQMNARMIEAVCDRLKFPMERVVMNIAEYGNTSAASIPIALDESVRSGRIKSGDLVLMSAMGAGITWGTAILRW